VSTSLLHHLYWWIPHWLLPRAQQVVSEHLRFVVGSCVDSEGISCCLAEIMCQSQSSFRTVCGIVCRSQNSIWIARGIKHVGVDRFGNSSRFRPEVEILSLSSLFDLTPFIFQIV